MYLSIISIPHRQKIHNHFVTKLLNSDVNYFHLLLERFSLPKSIKKGIILSLQFSNVRKLNISSKGRR